MRNKQLIFLLRFSTVSGNIIFILWVLFNGIKEGFPGTLIEKVSYVGLTLLLSLNSIFLVSKRLQRTQ